MKTELDPGGNLGAVGEEPDALLNKRLGRNALINSEKDACSEHASDLQKVPARKRPTPERRQQQTARAGPWQPGRDGTPGTVSGDVRILGLHKPGIDESLRNVGLEETIKLTDSGMAGT